MLRVLMITKPLVPPWNDAAKNHARDIITACPQVRFRYMSAIGGQALPLKHAKPEPVYSLPEPLPFWNKARVFLRLLKPDEINLYHFFFTPNALSSGMGRLALAMKPHQPSALTVCSRPLEHPRLRHWLFADRTVCVSEATRALLLSAGVEEVSVIPPAVPDVDVPTEEEIRRLRGLFGLPLDATIGLFAGDLEFGNAADTLLEALRGLGGLEPLHVVFCNRIKTPKARERLRWGRETIARHQLDRRVSILEPQADLNPLLKASDFLLLAPDTLYGKMDIPLVVLEGMSYAKPVILSKLPSLLEISPEGQAACFVEPGSPDELAHAIHSIYEKTTRQAMGIRAREIACERFSLRRLAADYQAFYRSFESQGGA